MQVSPNICCKVFVAVVYHQSSFRFHLVLSYIGKNAWSQPAFICYENSTTGFPKGVMSTHANLLHNLKLMEAIMKTNKLMVEVSFLPHFHDMGLICSYLQPLYSGGTGYFMSPVTFVENPGIWIEAFSRYKGTHR